MFTYVIIDFPQLTRTNVNCSDSRRPGPENLTADVIGLTGGKKAPFPHDFCPNRWNWNEKWKLIMKLFNNRVSTGAGSRNSNLFPIAFLLQTIIKLWKWCFSHKIKPISAFWWENQSNNAAPHDYCSSTRTPQFPLQIFIYCGNFSVTFHFCLVA